MTTETIKSLNIEAGNCKTDKNDEQSTAEVIIHAVSDPNTKDVVERTFCNFQCQEGYFDKDKGDKQILFECVPNPDRKDPLGQKKPAPTGCKGACVICVLAFSIALIVFGPGWLRRLGILSSITPRLLFYFTVFCSANVHSGRVEDHGASY